MTEQPPFYYGSRIGWRTWILDESNDQDPPFSGSWSVRSGTNELTKRQTEGGSGQFKLMSGAGTIWTPHERLTAHCRMRKDHPAPQLGCTCGIYAARSHSELRKMGYAAGPDDFLAADVLGELWMWGRIEESDNILRAEFAYPKKLYVPTIRWRWARPLRDTYAVPVEIKNVFTMEVPDETE